MTIIARIIKQTNENKHSGILARLKTNEFTLENRFLNLV